MTTQEFTTGLFCRVDAAMPEQQKHGQALLYPLFPRLPERARLFRLLAARQGGGKGKLNLPRPGPYTGRPR